MGVDLKYGITGGLTADFTYNTDFAQVEVDEQEVDPLRPVRRHELADRAFVIKINRLFRF